MIDEKILNELKKDYNLIQGKNGFKLYIKTETGSGDAFFLEYNNEFYCGYKIKNPNGKIIEKNNRTFEKIKAAQRYLVRICYGTMYSKLELDNN